MALSRLLTPAMADKQTLPYRRGVGLMVFNGDGKVFVARRNDMPNDAWQMPQGGIDNGETPQEAGLRELAEEIGTDRAEIVAQSGEWRSYDLPDHLIGKVWNGRFCGQTQVWLLLRFTGQDSDIDIGTKHPEFCEWRWADLETVHDLIVPFKRDVYRQVIDEFGPMIRDYCSD